MTDAGSLIEWCAFLNTQDLAGPVSPEVLRTTQKREELGITSLGVILLVANYMESCGLSNGEFNPDWVSKLDSVEGIMAIFLEIDHQKAKTPNN